MVDMGQSGTGGFSVDEHGNIVLGYRKRKYP